MQEQNNLDEVLISPLFIVGAGRSGTTWLQRMFLSHPGVIGGQESEFFLCMTPAIDAVTNVKINERMVGLATYWDREDFNEEIRHLWSKTFYPLTKGKSKVDLLVEKTPSHCIHMEAIKDVLPKAKFIHIIRDSRAVVSSMLAASRGWGRHWAPSNAKDAAIVWWRSVTAGCRNGANLKSEDYIEVNYECLLANPIDELRRMFDFAGLTYDDALLNKIVEENSFNKQKALTGSAFTTTKGEKLQEPKGFHRKGTADSWKTDLSLVEKITTWRYTRHLMHQCGYTWRGFIGKKK